jgi:predicted signal transduction protein with EAL and GGDEF domain
VSVVSVKVKREIKEKMLKYKEKVNWAEEIRKFIEMKIREIEAEENIKRVCAILSKIEFHAPKGSSVEMIREDRDGH